jgi:hypothetical protein
MIRNFAFASRAADPQGLILSAPPVPAVATEVLASLENARTMVELIRVQPSVGIGHYFIPLGDKKDKFGCNPSVIYITSDDIMLQDGDVLNFTNQRIASLFQHGVALATITRPMLNAHENTFGTHTGCIQPVAFFRSSKADLPTIGAIQPEQLLKRAPSTWRRFLVCCSLARCFSKAVSTFDSFGHRALILIATGKS